MTIVMHGRICFDLILYLQMPWRHKTSATQFAPNMNIDAHIFIFSSRLQLNLLYITKYLDTA